MLIPTRGIVLRTTPYSDSSLIVAIYTEQFGLQSYLVKGAKRKNSPLKANLFHPLTLLAMVVYHKEGKQLQTIKEARPEIHYHSISQDPVKTSLIFFLQEMFLKCLREEEGDPSLFDFLYETLTGLERKEKNLGDFHLIFLLRFSRYLGFFPQGKFGEDNPYFDLREGLFCSRQPNHPDFLNHDGCLLLQALLKGGYKTDSPALKNAAERKQMLDILLLYYQLHLGSMNNIKSHKVLESLLH